MGEREIECQVGGVLVHRARTASVGWMARRRLVVALGRWETTTVKVRPCEFIYDLH